MLTLRDIKVLHLEPTDVCQAACSLCARETDQEFDKNFKHHLDMHKILTVFNRERIAALDKMFMCGNYGDPAAGKHTFDIYEQFRSINPSITLGMNTNGGLQAGSWWQRLAKILNQKKDYVVFSIDGLADTNHVYRTHVNWNRLIENVQAFIESGGSAHWDMLVYQHNQHQVDLCQQTARRMGFRWFRAKVSRRGFTQALQAPLGWDLPRIENTIIKCHALTEQSLYIDAQGRISPCCWLGARQNNFINDFDEIQKTWHSGKPNNICISACGSSRQGTNFNAQWRREVELC